MSGQLDVVGLGTRRRALAHAGSRGALADAQMLYGYGPYLDRVPARAGQSGMRPTTARSARAPPRRCGMRRKARASRSYPAAIPACSPWRRRCARQSNPARKVARARCRVLPGITAMLAVAARIGAPLGHDFCALSLSDNLKPWPLIERRLERGGRRFCHRAVQSGVARAAVAVRRAHRNFARASAAATPVVFGRAVGRADESVSVIDADRRRRSRGRHGDLVIVGSPDTRVVARPRTARHWSTPRAPPPR